MFCLQSPATLDLNLVNKTTAAVLSLLLHSDEACTREQTMKHLIYRTIANSVVRERSDMVERGGSEEMMMVIQTHHGRNGTTPSPSPRTVARDDFTLKCNTLINKHWENI